jgi:hypothetical protein
VDIVKAIHFEHVFACVKRVGALCQDLCTKMLLKISHLQVDLVEVDLYKYRHTEVLLKSSQRSAGRLGKCSRHLFKVIYLL